MKRYVLQPNFDPKIEKQSKFLSTFRYRKRRLLEYNESIESDSDSELSD